MGAAALGANILSVRITLCFALGLQSTHCPTTYTFVCFWFLPGTSQRAPSERKHQQCSKGSLDPQFVADRQYRCSVTEFLYSGGGLEEFKCGSGLDS